MKKKLLTIGVYLLPVVVFAQTPIRDVDSLIDRIQKLIDQVIPLAIAIGVVVLVYGIIRYMVASTEDAKVKGKDYIIYGSIGLAAILSIWGLVNLITRSLNLDNRAPSNLEDLTPFN